MSIDYIWIPVIPKLTSVPGLYLRRTILNEETPLYELTSGLLRFLFTGDDNTQWFGETTVGIAHSSSVYRILYPDTSSPSEIGHTSILTFAPEPNRMLHPDV